MIKLSVVATAYAAEDFCSQFVHDVNKEVKEKLKLSSDEFEIVVVVDASPDNTFEILKKESTTISNLKYINLFSNVGQQLAMSCGISNASGETVIIMDGDFENPVSEIASLYKKFIDTEADVCYVISKKRQSFLRSFTSRLFYFSFNKIFNVGIVEDQLMMRAMSRKFVENFNLFSESKRTIASICHRIGGTYSTYEVTRRERLGGKSSYSVFSRIEVYLDILICMTDRPLIYLFYFGLFMLFLSFLLGVKALYTYFTIGSVGGYVSIISLLIFFHSVIILFLALIARYIGSIFRDSKRRPLYLIKEKNF